MIAEYNMAYQQNMMAEQTSASEDEILLRKRKIKKTKRFDSDSSEQDDGSNDDSKNAADYNEYFNNKSNTSMESIEKINIEDEKDSEDDMDEQDSQTQLDKSVNTNDFLDLNLETEIPETYKDFGKIKPGTKIKTMYNILIF